MWLTYPENFRFYHLPTISQLLTAYPRAQPPNPERVDATVSLKGRPEFRTHLASFVQKV